MHRDAGGLSEVPVFLLTFFMARERFAPQLRHFDVSGHARRKFTSGETV